MEIPKFHIKVGFSKNQKKEFSIKVGFSKNQKKEFSTVVPPLVGSDNFRFFEKRSKPRP